MKLICLILAFAVVVRANDTELKSDEPDNFNIDISVKFLNTEFTQMKPGDQYKYKVANDSYYVLTKPSDNETTLDVQVMIYSPGEEKHYLAQHWIYVWNDIAETLVALECTHHEVEIKVPTVHSDCKDAIKTASRIISIQLQGTVDLKDFDTSHLEKCLAEQLKPVEVEHTFTHCMITILGDPKYIGQALAQKILEEESKGKICLSNSDCYYAENPQIFSDILEELKGSSQAVTVWGDSRVRHCDLVGHSVNPLSEVIETNYGLKTFKYTCDYQVEEVSCGSNGNLLNLGFKYVTYAKNPEGNMVKKATDTFQTSAHGSKHKWTHLVDWENNQRLRNMQFLTNKDGITKEVVFYFDKGDGTTGIEKTCSVDDLYFNGRSEASSKKVILGGEIAGMDYAVINTGLMIGQIIVRN